MLKIQSRFNIFIILSLFFFLCFSNVSLAASISTADLYPFNTAEQTKQFHYLCKQFRCLACQNESLADSNAPLAKDLRYQIYKMVKHNKSNQEIINLLISHYGDFILFRPPLSNYTLFLWITPCVLLLIGLARLFWLVYQRKKRENVRSKKYHFSKKDRERIRHLLREH